MKIHKENIEEFMFDYFEGNLSDADKQQVLDFVHEYPEYEKDFVLWAKSYGHIGEPAPNYKLTDGLIQQGNKVSMHKYYWSAPVLILAALSFWWFGYSPESSQAPSLPKSEVLKSNTVVPQVHGDRSDVQASSPTSQKLRVETTSESKANTIEGLSPSVSEIGQVPKALNDERDESVQQIVPVAPLKQQDTEGIANRHETHINQTQIVKNSMTSVKSINMEKEPVPVKKKKKRNPIDLNASPKFIEQNPNF